MKNIAAAKNGSPKPATELDMQQRNVEDFRRLALRRAERATIMIQDYAISGADDGAGLRRAERYLIAARDAIHCMGDQIHELIASAIAEGQRRAREGNGDSVKVDQPHPTAAE